MSVIDSIQNRLLIEAEKFKKELFFKERVYLDLSNHRWTTGEDSSLKVSIIRDKLTVKQIALKHGRSTSAIYNRLRKLGLKPTAK